ncbi:MAG: nicotinamide-nucleotide amidase [Burkholderiales bacterium]
MISPSIQSESLDALAAQLGERLQREGAMLATAESCTGGWVAEAVTAIAGSSAWFDRGFVTYSNEAKMEMLGVPGGTIAVYGAVSEATVCAMALGALERSRAGVTVAITGVAGPGGGSVDKPVGTVWFGWAVRGGTITAIERRFSGDREAVRRQAVAFAIAGVIERI